MVVLATSRQRMLALAMCTILQTCHVAAFTSPALLPPTRTGRPTTTTTTTGGGGARVVELRESTSDDDASTSASALTEGLEGARDEADAALASVGWSSPMTDDEMTSDDPFVRSINDGIRRDVGVDLDELLNPSKVVNLERDLYNLRLELAAATGAAASWDDDDSSSLDRSTEECDGGGGGEAADKLRRTIAKKESDLSIERRSVFRGWLKNLFLGQAVLSLGLSWVMVTNPVTLVGFVDDYERLQLDTSVRVLGFWWWWLFIVPSLRSRRPSGAEKKALDVAFLGTPLVSLVSPVLTKDTPTIWLANLAVVLGAYGYAFFLAGDDDDDDVGDKKDDPEWLKFVYKSLDFGSGRERGARK